MPVSVSNGAQLQAALNAVTGPDVISCDPAGVYTGNFVLPNKSIAPGSYIVVRTSASDAAIASSATPWITPALSSSLARLSSPNSDPSLSAADGARHYKLIGLEALPNTSFPDRDLWIFGRDDVTTTAQLPDDIVVERCVLRGDSVLGQHRGIQFQVKNGVIRQSYFDRFVERNRDSQAVAAWNSPGPFLLENNFLEASGENSLFGGSDPSIANLVPSDITIRGNKFYKNPAWKAAYPGSVKNLFELKNARRVLVEGNLFENCWTDAQDGSGVLFTVRNQGNTAPWSTVQDVTFRYNVLKGIEGIAFNLLGLDDTWPSVQGTNVSIYDNLILDAFGAFLLNTPYLPTTITHNTFAALRDHFLQFTGNPFTNGSFTCTRNIFPSTTFGIVGEGTAGTGTLATSAPGATVTENIFGPQGSSLPSGNTVNAGTLLDTNYTYTGPQIGSDGRKPGADIAAIRARMPWLLLPGSNFFMVG